MHTQNADGVVCLPGAETNEHKTIIGVHVNREDGGRFLLANSTMLLCNFCRLNGIHDNPHNLHDSTLPLFDLCDLHGDGNDGIKYRTNLHVKKITGSTSLCDLSHFCAFGYVSENVSKHRHTFDFFFALIAGKRDDDTNAAD